MDREAFETEVSSHVAKARELILKFRTSTSPACLETLDQDIRAAFLRALGELSLSLNAEERIQRIKGRLKWDVAKSRDQTLTPVDHIVTTYPDRKSIGMLRRDLNDDEVDPKLYQALADWLRPKKDGSKNHLPLDFNLPKKSEATDIALDELDKASKGLTSSLGPADARLTRAVNARHSRSYRSRSASRKHSFPLAAE